MLSCDWLGCSDSGQVDFVERYVLRQLRVMSPNRLSVSRLFIAIWK